MADRGDGKARLSPKALASAAEAPRDGETPVPQAQLAAHWATVRAALQQEVGEVEYRTWLRQMTLVGLDGDEVSIRVPTRFLRDWVREHYGDLLVRLWQKENPTVRRVALRWGGAKDGGLAQSVASAPGDGPAAAPQASVASLAGAEERGSDTALLDPRFTDFGIGVAQDNAQKYCYVVLLCSWPRYVGKRAAQ